MSSDDLEIVIAIHIGDDDARPGSAHIIGLWLPAVVAGPHVPFFSPGRAIQHKDRVRRSDDLRRAVSVQIGHGG